MKKASMGPRQLTLLKRCRTDSRRCLTQRVCSSCSQGILSRGCDSKSAGVLLSMTGKHTACATCMQAIMMTQYRMMILLFSRGAVVHCVLVSTAAARA